MKGTKKMRRKKCNENVDLSVKLFNASLRGKDGLRLLMYEIDVSTIETLQARVLRQWEKLPEDMKKEYANFIISADNLPMCIQFNRIVSNLYEESEYLNSSIEISSKQKRKWYWDLYQEFYFYSSVLRERARKFEEIREETNKVKHSCPHGWKRRYC